MALIIKYKKDADAKSPSYAYEGDAGMDIFSNEEKTIPSSHRAPVKTGLYFEVPKGYVGLVWDKSGLALKQGIKTMAGVLDSGYRGELKIVLVNLSSQPFKIEKGMKIAQMLMQKVESAVLKEVRELSATERGDGGFGSSGLMHESLIPEDSMTPKQAKITEKIFRDKVKILTKLKPNTKIKLKKGELKDIKKALND